MHGLVSPHCLRPTPGQKSWVGKPTIFHALGEEAEQRQTLPETNTEHCVLHSPILPALLCWGSSGAAQAHLAQLCAQQVRMCHFPTVAAHWIHQDPHRDHLFSHLVKQGLQMQGSFVSCHKDLSFKDQRRGGRKATNIKNHGRIACNYFFLPSISRNLPSEFWSIGESIHPVKVVLT